MYRIQQGSEDLNSNGGIALPGALLNGLKNLGKIDNMKMGNIKKGWTSHSGILKSAAGLLVLGRIDFAVMQDLIHVACKIVSHSNRKYLKFWRNCPWFKVFEELYAIC